MYRGNGVNAEKDIFDKSGFSSLRNVGAVGNAKPSSIIMNLQ